MSKPLTRRPDAAPVLPSPEANGALVAVLTDRAQPMADPQSDLAQWRLANPLADWVSIDTPRMPQLSGVRRLRRKLSELLKRRHMQFGQLVLLGKGTAGRLALDLVLTGALPCAGVVGIDIPCAAPQAAVAHTTASVRLVLRKGEVPRARGISLISGLRRSDVDTRVMVLPSVGPEGAEAAVRAAGTFLFELIARACLHASEQGKFRYV